MLNMCTYNGFYAAMLFNDLMLFNILPCPNRVLFVSFKTSANWQQRSIRVLCNEITSKHIPTPPRKKIKRIQVVIVVIYFIQQVCLVYLCVSNLCLWR